MKRIWGNIKGLKKSQLRRLENFYRRKVPPRDLISPSLLKDTCLLSRQIRRQIGLLINRSGKIAYVIVGDQQSIFIPELREYRSAPARLRGLRCIHTHLKQEPLTNDDLTDLALLRLDLMAAVAVDPAGVAGKIHLAHIMPNSTEPPYRVLEPATAREIELDCMELIRSLEEEMAAGSTVTATGHHRERALLVGIATGSRKKAAASVQELSLLADSAGLEVIGTILQQRPKVDPRFLLGRGRLQQLAIEAMQRAASLIVFDRDLNPSQAKAISDQVELKVIDRTQLILDIFAQRARSREGKLQVELAQLRYLLPRLVNQGTSLSRLAGGIGGRGPGETKLEIDRRRARERIHRLEKELELVKSHRLRQRQKRRRRQIPVISIIGYTNAGKSTLLNTLTHSRVRAENRLFATLDPTSKRLRFPRDLEVIITDTVGFIHNLPKDLIVAFRATLEELENADLLLHVIDISNPDFAHQVRCVDRILSDLGLNDIAQLRVLNKADLVEAETVRQACRRLQAIAVCARKSETLTPLISSMSQVITRLKGLDRREDKS